MFKAIQKGFPFEYGAILNEAIAETGIVCMGDDHNVTETYRCMFSIKDDYEPIPWEFTKEANDD